MNKNPPFRKNVALFIVLLTVLVCLVLPVAGDEDGAGPSETIAPPEPPLNITNATAPALNLSLAADPPTGPVPLTVRFTAAVQGLAVDLWTWTVDGVAAVGNESTFNHTFHEPGTHVVGLTAVNESASVTNTSSVDINVTVAPAPAAAPPAVVLADGAGAGHPRDWYVSATGNGNVTGLLNITDLGDGDTVHIWGAAGHTYEGGFVIDKPNVTVKRWEGSPAQPLITNSSGTAPAFTVTANNATFRDLNISDNQLNGKGGAGINAVGSSGIGNHLERLTITNCTFVGNTVTGTNTYGGALYALLVNDLLVEGTAFTGNTADDGGGGAWFYDCYAATLTNATFTNNTAQHGGGAGFWWCNAATLTGTTFTGNTAVRDGGGAYFYECDAATITNCRFDNPTNIYAITVSSAVLNTARTRGTNIAGGPYLGGNLWLQDPKQNISERAADADFDGICDGTLTISGIGIFSTDYLPLMHGGGTVVINATPADAFVFVNNTNTTRTAGNAFYLPVGNHTISVQKEGYLPAEKQVTIVPGENDPLTFDLQPTVEHPKDWYVSKFGGDDNVTSLLNITDLDAGDTVHIWGVAGHTYEGGFVIDKPNVTVKRWEGSPVQPLITNRSGASAFTVTANNATFLDLNISENHLNYDQSRGAGINAFGTYTGHLERLTITNCTFAGNKVTGMGASGGALSARYVDAFLVEGTAFTGNSATDGSGGGARFKSCYAATLANTTFTGNTASSGGGASFSSCSFATLTGTTFTNNNASGSGGGTYFSGCYAATLTTTTFTGNNATNGGGGFFEDCDYATFTGTTFIGNTATLHGGGACFWGSGATNYDGTTLTNATFTGNNATNGGGALIFNCNDAALTNATFTGNNATNGGGALFLGCYAATLTGTTFTGNTATDDGGGACFSGCDDATITNCRFDNPTNIHAEFSAATALNTTRTRGTNIAGGPFLGGNLWLQDPAQNISERGADADFDGICDQPLSLGAFGTDHLPLMHGGGTVVINATPADAFVYVDTINTTRTAGNAFYLPVGNHTISVHKAGYFAGEQKITVSPAENDPLDFTLIEIIHPMDWYVSTITGNYTTISAIPEIGTGDTIHVWGVEGHAYDSGVVIGKPHVTVKRWEGSPVQPLITTISQTAPAFTVTADNATFLDLNISRNTLNDTNGAAINAVGTSGDLLQRLTITNCTFADNAVNGTNTDGGALSAKYVDALLVEGTAFTGNTASSDGGGAIFEFCNAANITGTTFTDNTAGDYGGGADFEFCTGATLTDTTFTDNTAGQGGGGAGFGGCTAATLTNCRFDNPTNIHARGSTAVLNGTYASGTTIAGGPYLGGNLWLNDPAQNISECGKDADFDGICDENLSIPNFGTDELPLIYDPDRGTVQINATPADAFVSVDGTNTTRTAGGAFYLPVGNHTVSVHKEGFFTCEQDFTITAGENDPLTFDLMESTHPIDWYVSTISGNFSSLQEIPEIGEGDTIHIWGMAGQAYEGGIVINASDVTIRQWEGSPVKPLITSTNHTAPAFTVTAPNATFRGLDISGNRLDDEEGLGAGISAARTSRLTIADCTFTGNAVNGTEACGGALGAAFVDDISVERTQFTGNNATQHGGAACFVSCTAPALADTTFTDNHAARDSGAALFFKTPAAALANTTFTRNTAGHDGGGVEFVFSDNATLANTHFTDNRARYGGGANIFRSNNTMLTVTAFTDNIATEAGGAVNATGTSRLTIADCTFTGNAANGTDAFGGALSAGYVDDLLIERTAFTGNNATRYGGGARFLSCNDSVLTDTTFTDNVARFGGGVQFLFCNDSVFTNATVTGNRASSCGGGADFLYSHGPVTITDTAFTDNTAPNQGGGARFYIAEGSCATLNGTAFIGNAAGFGGGAYFAGSYRAALPAAVLAGATFVNNTAEKFGGGAYLVDCDEAMLTALSFDGNSADDGGGAYFYQCDAATLNTSVFAGNRAAHAGGAINVTGHCGSSKVPLQHFAIADCTFTGNAADQSGGALSARAVDNLSVERTVFTGNDAPAGGGTHLSWCNDTFVADCRFENPTNVRAEHSTGVLNATRTRGTTIAGGPYLGGNLWLNDPEQNISEWGPDIDCDGICDQPLTIPGLGTDHLPLATGGDRGTVLVRASAHGGFVHIDGTNTTRTADHFPAPAPVRAANAPTPPSDAFFLPAGNHTVEIVGATTYGRAVINLSVGATEPVIVEVGEVEIRGYARPRQGLAPLNVSFDTWFPDPEPDRHTWTFGDGNESSPCYWPSHTYEKAGTYTATLTAGWGEGSDLVTLVRTVNVTVGMPAPVLHLSATEGNAPFTLGINVSGDGMPETWHLDLGDGRTVEGASPAEINRSVTYEKAGTYPLVLTVSTGTFVNTTTAHVTVHAPPATPSSESNSGHSPISAGSTGSIPAGESASMKMKGMSIYEVRVTAGEDIPKVMITIEKTGRPSGVDAPAGTVYEYDEVTLYHTTEDAIEEIVVSFGVPKTWLEEHGIDPADVALYRYDNDGWQPLPTSVDGEDETSWHFSARSPGFFLFAIGGEPSPLSTPVMTPAAAAETVETLATPAAAGPATPATDPPFPTMLLVVGGAIAILVVGVVVWRRR
ncbi:PEGA domain-containing protein [Methanofollis formosanus]|uniref:PEGA domain-containing protein n=1 Tax=Methanofollis formosanus TaxID=299308 RepID=A0A8G1EGI8_9EURY|nr:NosD domain-containing protein [Methanofollis formosanus]QYZ78962.1 PEGA domain-containing protein [Methanofollis formosanus]